VLIEQCQTKAKKKYRVIDHRLNSMRGASVLEHALEVCPSDVTFGGATIGGTSVRDVAMG
jgi:hypothetical protein